MIHKAQVLQTIQTMPDIFSVEDLMDKLLLINKIENGLTEVTAQKTISHEEAKDKLKKWL
jgi:hypothetical protein